MGANTGAEARLRAVATAAARKPRDFRVPGAAGGSASVVSTFGARTFDLRTMRDKLPKPIYRKIIDCIENKALLDASIAAGVAHAAKEWAIENGATHFCHWFQPLTGLTAEKHDAFLDLVDGEPLDRFRGEQLIQSEPDASSFPSGGARTTFEARGYTAWDPSSPMFLMSSPAGATLCIPSAYLSYLGDALDEKTGLLRSLEALDKAVDRLYEVLGEEPAARVTSTVGAEQEYFLVDRALCSLRSDLMLCGRTVIGAAPAKGQQLDDHYFGAIPPRIDAFMREFEHELYLLGVPVKTRHNEVAPGQYEMAPVFEEANVAADHNQLAMEVMRRVARRHDLRIFFHEKPFAGINGTGKHLNWSVAAKRRDGTWDNLFEPGETPAKNKRFLLMTAAVLRAIHRHAGVLRAAISGAGNDHRLGANEAPPAIISVFMGRTLTSVFDALAGKASDADVDAEEALSLGVRHLPDVKKDNTDRNRTSPFAFTGNKWEFRACGGSAAISFPTTVLTAAVAEAIADVAGDLEQRLNDGLELDKAIATVLEAVSKETSAVRFEGDNYSEDWRVEAERRGLPNLRNTSQALDWLADPQNHAYLLATGVFTEGEISSRIHVRVERYLHDLDIECEAMLGLVDTAVTPAASAYLGALCESVNAAKAAGVDAPQRSRAHEVSKHLAALSTRRDELVALRHAIGGEEADDLARARRYAHELVPAMDGLRAAADALETLCDDGLWPLPRYQEMLFIR